MFYIRKPNSNTITLINLDYINQPQSGNWAASLNFFIDQNNSITYALGEEVIIENPDYNISYHGYVRTLNYNKFQHYMVITGITKINETAKSKQYTNSTFYQVIKQQDSTAILSTTDFALSYWVNKGKSKHEVISDLCNQYGINWYINNSSKYVIGNFLTDIDLSDIRSTKTKSMTEMTMVIDIDQFFKSNIVMANNVNCIQYREKDVKIWIQ